MRILTIIAGLLVVCSAHSQPAIDCDAKDLSDYDIRVCENRAKEQVIQRHNDLLANIKDALKQRVEVEKANPIGWGISAETTLDEVAKSDALWRQLMELDCGIEIGSPYFSGGTSSSAALNDCYKTKYEQRIKQLYLFAEYWELEV